MLAAGAMTIPQSLLFVYVPFVISTTFHEAAHALVAKLGGDDTAYRGGQVSLNPIPHIQRSPFGMVVLPLFLLFTSGMLMGFASAPIDPYWAARNPKRAAMVSLAGPVTNFLLAIIAFCILFWLIRSGIEIHEGGNAWVASKIVEWFLILNVVLGILNLIPLPPLDGAGVVEGFFPNTVGPLYSLLRGQPFIVLLLLVVIMRYGDGIYDPVFDRINLWLAGR